MVLVEEVPEETLLREGERESDFETDSNASDGESFLSDDLDEDELAIQNETYAERIAALKDIIPPQTRSSLYAKYTSTKEWTWWTLQGCGSVAWWVSTSALLVGLPLALAIEDETKVVQQEREMQMQSAGQQQVGSSPVF